MMLIPFVVYAYIWFFWVGEAGVLHWVGVRFISSSEA